MRTQEHFASVLKALPGPAPPSDKVLHCFMAMIRSVSGEREVLKLKFSGAPKRMLASSDGKRKVFIPSFLPNKERLEIVAQGLRWFFAVPCVVEPQT